MLHQPSPFQLLEYQWGEGRFDINKLPASPLPPCVKFMTEVTSMPLSSSFPPGQERKKIHGEATPTSSETTRSIENMSWAAPEDCPITFSSSTAPSPLYTLPPSKIAPSSSFWSSSTPWWLPTMPIATTQLRFFSCDRKSLAPPPSIGRL